MIVFFFLLGVNYHVHVLKQNWNKKKILSEVTFLHKTLQRVSVPLASASRAYGPFRVVSAHLSLTPASAFRETACNFRRHDSLTGAGAQFRFFVALVGRITELRRQVRANTHFCRLLPTFLATNIRTQTSTTLNAWNSRILHVHVVAKYLNIMFDPILAPIKSVTAECVVHSKKQPVFVTKWVWSFLPVNS